MNQTNQFSRQIIIIVVAITMGMSCMVYEFALAQTLSLLLGHSAMRYQLTIGLYAASLGFGSLFYKKILNQFIKRVKKSDAEMQNVQSLIFIEILISIISSVTFGLLFLFDRHVNSFLMEVLSHLVIILIGFLNGVELPLLMEVSEDKQILLPSRVLAADYLGTLLGAILFPLVLLPQWHLFSIVASATIVNLLSAILLQRSFLKNLPDNWQTLMYGTALFFIGSLLTLEFWF